MVMPRGRKPALTEEEYYAACEALNPDGAGYDEEVRRLSQYPARHGWRRLAKGQRYRGSALYHLPSGQRSQYQKYCDKEGTPVTVEMIVAADHERLLQIERDSLDYSTVEKMRADRERERRLAAWLWASEPPIDQPIGTTKYSYPDEHYQPVSTDLTKDTHPHEERARPFGISGRNGVNNE
jgi:hypothetical protein